MINENETSSSINIELIFTFSAYTNEKELFSIDLFINKGYLNLHCIKSEKNKTIKYLCKVAYEELKNNKILSLAENLEQAFNYIKDLINNNIKSKNNPSIEKQTNGILLKIPVNIGNLDDLMFNLIQKENN